MAQVVTYTSKDHVAVITLNRPERMNRMDDALMDGLHAAWKRFMATPDDRVAVLTGAGTKAFCAGADLANPPRGLYPGIPGVGVAVDKPVIAAVAGWCVGGGMVLTTMCDLMICADNAQFTYPEVKVGFSGGLITNLVTRIPHKIAMELLLLGDTIDAKRAYEVGYANKVVPVDQLMPAAMDWAVRIAANAPLPTRAPQPEAAARGCESANRAAKSCCACDYEAAAGAGAFRVEPSARARKRRRARCKQLRSILKAHVSKTYF